MAFKSIKKELGQILQDNYKPDNAIIIYLHAESTKRNDNQPVVPFSAKKMVRNDLKATPLD